MDLYVDAEPAGILLLCVAGYRQEGVHGVLRPCSTISRTTEERDEREPFSALRMALSVKRFASLRCLLQFSLSFVL